ncbi:MAG: putative transposase [Verrucomicrobiales bacterium]|jgi:putative transposase
MYTAIIMSRRTILPALQSSSHYHCISRVVDRNFIFQEHERDVFRKILRQVEAFSGVQVLTWTILSNHFHVLVEVPPKPLTEPTDDEILERCRSLYSPQGMIEVEWQFSEALRMGGADHARLRARFLKRMWDLSEFMKTLKQKFTMWFNRTHDRVGVLWESRFKSVIVEGHWNSLLTVAAYIDLNSVRAGMATDPKDYRWCGYSEAVAGDRNARRGISRALADLKPDANWGDVGPRYRNILFGIGEENSARTGLSREEVAKVWANGGKLSLPQLLRCRVRYFSDGLAVGSESFLESVFSALGEFFSARRETCSRKMAGGTWEGLRVARALRVKPVDPGYP